MRGSFDLSKTIYSKIASVLPNKADKNLGNVANGDFLNKMKASGFNTEAIRIKYIQPILLATGAGIANKNETSNVNINAQYGIFYFFGDSINLHRVNKQSGSVYSLLNKKGVTVSNGIGSYYRNTNSFIISAPNIPILIITFGYTSPVIEVTYVSNQVGAKISNIEGINLSTGSTSGFSVYKIAEVL